MRRGKADVKGPKQAELVRLARLRSKCADEVAAFMAAGVSGYHTFAAFLAELIRSPIVDRKDWLDWVAGEAERLKERLVARGLHNE